MADSLERRFWSRVDKGDEGGCWIWKGAAKSGSYGSMVVDGKQRRATHVSVMLATGSWPETGMMVCHKCDNPPCVRPDHLFVGTCGDNVRDMVAKGRHKYPYIPPEAKARGSKHGLAKLDERKVALILASPDGWRKIAAQFGVERTTVRAIRQRRTWKHVKPATAEPGQ